MTNKEQATLLDSVTTHYSEYCTALNMEGQSYRIMGALAAALIECERAYEEGIHAQEVENALEAGYTRAMLILGHKKGITRPRKPLKES
jgi:hypothetical protein